MAHFATAGIDFDGVVAQSDQQAMAVFNSLARLGINVPGQVRIIGVDNAPFCELNLVPLSSVSQQDLLRGQKAVQLLLGRIKGRAVENISIPPVLWPRESSR
jgi:DNA-binding LacI/PurR family transcriptional regulator